ncbi:MAG: DMT family transporter [Candidatus Eisenbacteria bacterium]
MTGSPQATVPGSSTHRLGILYMLGAAFFFSLMSLLVKIAGRTLPAMELVLARGVVTLIISWTWLRAARIPMWGTQRKLLVIRGVLGFCGLACFYFAITRLPLAEVTTIHFLNPVLTALLAALLLRESVGWPLAVAIVTSLGGVLLVSRPDFLFGARAAALDPAGLAAAIGGAIFSAGAYVAVRKLARTDHALVIVFYFPLVAVPATLPLVWPVFVWPRGIEWWWLLGIGVSTQIAQMFLTTGLARLSAGRAMTVGYTQIVFAALWGAIFFDAFPDAWSAVGAILVIGGASLLAFTRDAPPGTARPGRSVRVDR